MAVMDVDAFSSQQLWALAALDAEFRSAVLKLDDEGEIIPGRGRLVRVPGNYARGGLNREHFLFKGCPIFLEDPAVSTLSDIAKYWQEKA